MPNHPASHADEVRARLAQRRLWEAGGVLGALILLLLVAWLSGRWAQADLQPALHRARPGAHHFRAEGEGLFRAFGDAAERQDLGFVALGMASGYGGPLELAVAVDGTGHITGVAVASHKESLEWFERVMKAPLPSQLFGKGPLEPFQVGRDLDGVTGATYSAKALGEAALRGNRRAAQALGLPLPPLPEPPLRFVGPEWVVLGLFGLGLLAHHGLHRLRRQARWVSLLTGLLFLGFVYTLPLTLGFVARLLLGYWPPWQTHLYWYLLLGGLVLLILLEGRNVYCAWFCPFGAAQECVGVLGGAKVRTPRRHHRWLQWFQRAMALGALLLGVWYRNPLLASFEPFGALFSLTGSGIQFIVLGLVLLAALYLRRPWCGYLCPVSPVLDGLLALRTALLQLWPRNRGNA